MVSAVNTIAVFHFRQSGHHLRGISDCFPGWDMLSMIIRKTQSTTGNLLAGFKSSKMVKTPIRKLGSYLLR
jgi:hypothetical protein